MLTIARKLRTTSLQYCIGSACECVRTKAPLVVDDGKTARTLFFFAFHIPYHRLFASVHVRSFARASRARLRVPLPQALRLFFNQEKRVPEQCNALTSASASTDSIPSQPTSKLFAFFLLLCLAFLRSS